MTEDMAVLIYRTALGDQRAFDRLYHQSSPKLYALALMVVKRKDLAEEALQDAFVSIWHSAQSYSEDKGTAQTWLNTIVRNRCLDKLRRQPKGISDLKPEEWENMIADTPEPLEEVLADDDAKRLNGCLEHLDDKQRQSVMLAYFQGLSHSQLATQLGAPLGTVKAWVRRGLDKLKGCLQL